MKLSVFNKLKKKIKHLVYSLKLFLKSKETRRFWFFQNLVKSKTGKISTEILQWGDLICTHDSAAQACELSRSICSSFKDSLSNTKLRFLVHLPACLYSPGGYSAFKNIIEGLQFLGVPTEVLEWNESISDKIKSFKPNVLLTSDHIDYIDRIDWMEVKKYSEKNRLIIGISATTTDSYWENKFAGYRDKYSIDNSFYYSFGCDEFIQNHFLQHKNKKTYSIEFGVNPLRYYSMRSSGLIRDIDFVFLGSSNYSKTERYIEYFNKIIRNYKGCIAGPGWFHTPDFAINSDRDRFIYARSKVGLNLHVDVQLNEASELNERTYMLAACGVPQVVDNPVILSKRFDASSFFVATNPDEYYRLFTELVKDPGLAVKQVERAQEEVFKKHTVFHRLERFISQLEKDFNYA